MGIAEYTDYNCRKLGVPPTQYVAPVPEVVALSDSMIRKSEGIQVDETASVDSAYMKQLNQS